MAALLNNAILRDSTLSGTPFVGAYLVGADLSGTPILIANFAGADKTGVRMNGAVYDEDVCWSEGFAPVEHGAVPMNWELLK